MKIGHSAIGIFLAMLSVIALTWSDAFAGHGPGPGMGGGGGGSGGGSGVYDDTFTSQHFSGSGNCQMCHNSLSDFKGADVSIEKDWSSTMMAHSTRDPLWRAKVRSELNRNPQLAEIINNKCTKCHAPMANTEAHFWGDYISVFNGGLLDPSNLHYDEAIDGVSCTLCHQITDSPLLGSLGGFSGGYEVATYANPTGRPIFGQYGNILTQPMRNNVQYTPIYSAHIHESAICATCHNLKTPYVDENGEILSTTPDTEFPEQMPYSEWEHSSYVNQKSCQDCHMPRTNGVVIASRPMWINTPRDDFGIHRFAGGNLLLLDILNTNRQELGVTSSNFNEAITGTSKLLQAAVDIEVLQSSLSAGQLNFRLKISSNSGHKLPSGIPLRRVILHVSVQDNKGRTVFETGRVNTNGSVVGIEADADPSLFEPHYDLITEPDQVQVYETVMVNNLGEVTFTLLRASDYIKDNRLLPAGFVKSSAGTDIQVVGAALDDTNFQGGSDEIDFRIEGLSRNLYNVKAELVFQPMAFPAFVDLTSDTDVEIDTLKNMFNVSSQKSIVMKTLQFQIRN